MNEIEKIADSARKAMLERQKNDLIDILSTLDKSVSEAIKGEKTSIGELKSIIIVSIVSLKQDFERSKKSMGIFKKKVSSLSQLEAFKK